MTKSIAICLGLLVSVTALGAGRKVVPILIEEPGAYPAEIAAHLEVSVNGEILRQLAEQCGVDARVTDLDVRTRILHNQVPGTATIRVKGRAVCQVR